MSRLISLVRPLAILAIALLLAVLMVKSRPQLEAKSVSIPVPLVTVQTVAKEELPVTVVAYGNVTAWRQLELTAQVGGRVLWQSPLFEPGVVVEAGEPLLRIDPTDYELALAEARQALSSAKLSLADAKSLRQAARVEEAEAAVAAAQARIVRAQRDLKNTEIVAPYRAVIDEQTVEFGQFISVGTRVGRIFGADRAEVRLPVPPQDVRFIQDVDTAGVTLHSENAGDVVSWKGRVSRVEARIDTQTRSFPVLVTVDNPLDLQQHSEPMRFGLFVRAQITGGTVPEAVLLPQSALHGENDVFVYSDGLLQRRRVTVARVGPEGVLVTDGLADGEQVVITRLELMFEGMAVAVSDV
ncbi:efflux RND transporter periplasmic adaptor subunit [Congregibacter variabilis]|uniref:Efflux RND transporter periplasmic adaptor subunit n=1 Tax=Congregibacter variabilis TaxID=3081200 RepID=A0ABZ0I1R7_9GAMM|nr:efflux RND transporter periplasmic adaptor subunit [Congregibacter sp. IMCC43200]